MKRIPEHELMDGYDHARAYADADLAECEYQFIEQFKKTFHVPVREKILDLGCGPGGITRCFARSFDNCRIHALDGSEAMIKIAVELTNKAQLTDRIKYLQGILPNETLPINKYDVIISNSLLHHLADPMILWKTIKKYATEGTQVLINDLIRPKTREDAAKIVERDAKNESEVFRIDFYNSLLASFDLNEVERQLKKTQLNGLSLYKIADGRMSIVGCIA